MAIDVTAIPAVINFTGKMGILSHTPPAPRNPELDQVIDCSYSYSSDGSEVEDVYPFIPQITLTALGTWFNVTISASPAIITMSAIGTDIMGELWRSDASATGDVATITVEAVDAWITLEGTRRNWVKWSNIGALDFTVWKDNVAGERPMDWKGWVYAIKKRVNMVVVYGENGVSILTPAGNAWGLRTIHRVGLKGPGAVCGSDKEHFFVDAEGRLFQLDEEITELGYSEYLSVMSSAIRMSWDEENETAYICDGDYGYIYSPKDKSLGGGPVNITGLGYQSGVAYIAAPATISTPAFEICTDIYDFGTRRAKTVRNVQLGTDLTSTLTVAIDYRRDKSSTWSTTEWRTVNAEGVAYITCYGTEFRFKVKSSAYEYFELDYINIQGELHDY